MFYSKSNIFVNNKSFYKCHKIAIRSIRYLTRYQKREAQILLIKKYVRCMIKEDQNKQINKKKKPVVSYLVISSNIYFLIIIIKVVVKQDDEN